MSEDHLVDIVNERDEVIDQQLKEIKFQKELISRNVVAFLQNPKGELIIVKRSAHKRSWPNRLDLATCGNVNAGEDYEDAIRREIQEELSIDPEVKFIDKIYTEVEENGLKVRYFTGVFAGTTDQEPKLSDEHLELRFITIEELDKLMQAEPDLFSPSFIREFILFKDLLADLSPSADIAR